MARPRVNPYQRWSFELDTWARAQIMLLETGENFILTFANVKQAINAVWRLNAARKAMAEIEYNEKADVYNRGISHAWFDMQVSRRENVVVIEPKTTVLKDAIMSTSGGKVLTENDVIGSRANLEQYQHDLHQHIKRELSRAPATHNVDKHGQPIRSAADGTPDLKKPLLDDVL